MKRLALLLVSLTLVGLTFAQEAAQNPIEIRIETFLVSVVQGDEQLRPATTARPGQIVEYRITAINRSEETLPEGIVEIIGPIPEGTSYVPNSATPASERVLTEYSAPGSNEYSAEPVMVGESEDREVAEPNTYDAIRWTLLVPMEPGQEETFFYRVQVDQDD
ncbi:MAG TPA: hypothetical protein VF168_08945 [Trueperaceae bacterium]